MADLGQKHECSECGAKFYDLGKPDPDCPRCGAPVSGEAEEPKPKSRKKRRAASPAKAAAAVAEPVDRSLGDGDEDLGNDDVEDIDEDLDEDLEEFEDEDEDEDLDDEDDLED